MKIPTLDPETRSRWRARLKKEAIEWGKTLALTAIVVAFVRTWVVEGMEIKGHSMSHTLEHGERVFVNKLSYRLAGFKRGDIAFLWSPEHRTRLVKRIIALPGEEIEIRRGRVYIDGEKLNEPYVPKTFRSYESIQPTTVPENHYFVMGDHRNSSNDSRFFSFVPEENLLGTALLRFWPVWRVSTF